MSGAENPRRSRHRGAAEWGAFAIVVGMSVVVLLLWRWLSPSSWSDVDPMSSLGLLIMAGIVCIGFLVEWFQDWRMLRALRRYLAKTRARDPHGPEGGKPMNATYKSECSGKHESRELRI